MAAGTDGRSAPAAALPLTIACLLALLPAPAVSPAKPAEPKFRDFPQAQQARLLDRVKRAPAPYRRLVRSAYPLIRVRANPEMINGSYVFNRKVDGERRFIVHLDVLTRRHGDYGDHLTSVTRS